MWPFKKDNLSKNLRNEINDLKNHIDELQELEIYEKMIPNGQSESGPGTISSFVDEIVDKNTLQKLYRTEGWVYIAVNTIAKQVASLPIKLQKRHFQDEELVKPDGGKIGIKKEVWIDVPHLPLSDVFKNPNQEQPSMIFLLLLFIDLLTTGECFIYVDRQESTDDSMEMLRNAMRRSAINGIHRINSCAMTPMRDKETGQIDHYVLNFDNEVYKFLDKEIIHIVLPDPTNPDAGLAPLVPVMKKIMLDRYSSEHMIRFYKQGARLGGVIKTSRNLTKEQISRLEKSFEANYTGKRNHHRTLILPTGMDYEVIEQNPGQQSLIEFQNNNKEQILSAYGTPPIKVGLLDGATFANANIQNKTFYEDTVRPLLIIFEQSINTSKKIIKDNRSYRYKFDLSEIEALRNDTVEKGDVARGMVATGLSINEIRARVWQAGAVEGGEMIPLIQKLEANTTLGGLVEHSFSPNETKNDVANAQNDMARINSEVPTTGTFEERVVELVGIAVAEGIDISIATRRAVEQALNEGFEPSTNVDMPEDDEKALELQKKKEVIQAIDPNTVKKLKNLLKTEQVEKIIKRRAKSNYLFLSKMKLAALKKLKQNTKSIKSGDEFITNDDFLPVVQEFSTDVATNNNNAVNVGFDMNLPNKNLTFDNDLAKAVLDRFAAIQVRYVTEATRDALNKIITDSFANQDSPTEMINKIQNSFIISPERAEKIARTETLTAVSIGQQIKIDVFKNTFPEDSQRLFKVWISANDSKVRFSHQMLEGEVRQIDEEFSNGLKFPREPFSPAEESINCRCTFLEFFLEDGQSILDALSML